MIRCDKCYDLLPEEEVRVCFDGDITFAICDYCIEERLERDRGAKVVNRKALLSGGIAIGDTKTIKAQQRLRNAEDNLRQAIRRYFKNCPSIEVVRRIVSLELEDVLK